MLESTILPKTKNSKFLFIYNFLIRMYKTPDIYHQPSVIEELNCILKADGIVDILEWTFMYDAQSRKDGLPYNTTLFEKIWGCSYANWKIRLYTPEEIAHTVWEKLQNWITTLDKIKEHLDTSNPDRLTLESEGIDYVIASLRTAQYCLPIELEKSMNIPILTDKERNEIVWMVDKGQEILYWGKVSENPEEIRMSLELLCQEYQEWNSYLTNEQKTQFLELYNRLAQRAQEFSTDTRKIDIPNPLMFHQEQSKEHPLTKQILEKAGEIQISKEDYMLLWQLYIDSMDMRQQVREDPQASSIFDWPNSLDVPTGEKYETKNLREVLMLMVHEIGAHYSNQAIHENAGFQVRWARNIMKEEGLAILMEWIFEGKKIQDMKQAWYSYPYILAGELLAKEDRQNLVELRIRMDKDVQWKHGDTNHQRDLRIMRWYSLDWPWAQRKDSSYGRWALQIVQAIREGKASILDFFQGKFSIEDILSWRVQKVVKPENRVFPLLFPDMILFMFGQWREDFTHEHFMVYMREKYQGDIPDEYLDNIQVIKSFSKLKTFVTMTRLLRRYNKK